MNLPEKWQAYKGEESFLDVSTTNLLKCLSDANDGLMGAILIVILAIVYAVLGSLGLLLGGVIFGAFLHATWEGHYGLANNVRFNDRQREVSLDVAQRLLKWQSARSRPEGSEQNGAKADIAMQIASGQLLNFSEYPSEVNTALDELVNAAIEDYVKYWYSPLLPQEEDFPATAKQTLVRFLSALASHQSRKRPADAFLTFLTNATSVIILFLNELSQACACNEGTELGISELIISYLKSHPQSALADIVDAGEQEKKFSLAADDLLQAFLDHKTYNCETMRIFFKNIFAGVVLKSVLTTISQPEWINGWIVSLLEEGEPEILNALDAGVGRATKNSPIQSSLIPDGMLADDQQKRGLDQKDGIASESAKRHGEDTTTQTATEEARRLTQMIADEDASRFPQSGSTGSKALNPSEQRIEVYSTLSTLTASDRAFAPDPQKEQNLHSENAINDSFTNFDQIVPPYRANPAIPNQTPLTLHRAKVTLLDDINTDEKMILKARPHTEYLIQIEPAVSSHSGWMVARTFQEFEPLHEYLYKIANVSGAPTFSRRYQTLPPFKGKARSVVRQDLERYLCDSLAHETLAESEGMKKFLDKDQGFSKSAGARNALKLPIPVGDAFQSVGKGVLGGFNSATKGVAAGSQAVFEGVGGLFAGQRKITITQARASGIQSPVSRETAEIRDRSNTASVNDDKAEGESADSAHDLAPDDMHPLQVDDEPATIRKYLTPSNIKQVNSSVDPTRRNETLAETSSIDFGGFAGSQSILKADVGAKLLEQDDARPEAAPADEATENGGSISTSPTTISIRKAPINEEETRVAVELIFAAITELFTLSGVWNIRRTLLNAAKSYILRPGNPALASIHDLLQSSISSACSAATIGDYVRKIRENSLPTPEELATWPPLLKDEEKEELRRKARLMLIDKGMPQALTSIMGATASREALGCVFDALQIETIRRGIMSALILHAVKLTIY